MLRTLNCLNFILIYSDIAIILNILNLTSILILILNVLNSDYFLLSYFIKSGVTIFLYNLNF